MKVLNDKIANPVKFHTEYKTSPVILNQYIYVAVRLLDTLNRSHFPYLDSVLRVYLCQHEDDVVTDINVYKIRFLFLSMMSQHVVWFEINEVILKLLRDA